ncbi:uncharacterized protein [Diadema antillarum]|uniref:uncharacterized protein n=1 Tax=Diadema antillarum TaxID=105358 RepID=UPI003A850AC1
MPKCTTIDYLSRLCINHITANVDFWTRDYEKNILDKGRYRLMIGPFDDLPSPSLAHALLARLIDRRKLTRPALHLLINGGALQHLDFSECTKLVTDEIVYMLASRCKKIKSLNLRGCRRVTTSALEVLANNLPFAVKLDFSKTKISSLAVQSLFRLCSDLQELSLQHCQVCDNDVGILCNLAMQHQRFQLRKLDLYSSMVTETGIRALLRSIPQLCELHNSNLISSIIAESPITEEYAAQYLRTFSQSSEDGRGLGRDCVDRERGQNGLRLLECSDFTTLSDSHLKLISFLCPQLTSLDLRFARGFSSRGVSDLAGLEHLRELKLASSGNLTVLGVWKYLEKRGAQLKALSLEDFDGLDLLRIGVLCPNLCRLLVFMMLDDICFHSGDETPPGPQRPFQHLEDMALWCTNTNITLTEAMLSYVFPQCRSLRTLEVIRVASFNDAIIAEAMASHGFRELQSLTLHECNAVTSQGISQLVLDGQNSLEALTLMDCFAINRRDYEGWCKVAKKLNYNLNISWK